MRPDMITRGLALIFGGVTAAPRPTTTSPADTEFSEPVLVNTLMLTTTAAVTVLLVWASFAKLDDIARTGGILVARGNNAVVQHQEGGTLKAIYVREGQLVQSGQPLLKLNDTDIRADSATIQQRMDFLSSQVRRLGYVLGLPQSMPAALANSAQSPIAELITSTMATSLTSATSIPTTTLLPPPDLNSAALNNPSIFANIEPAAGIDDPEQDPQAVALMERRRTLRSGLGLAQSEYQRQVKLRQQGYGTQSRVYAAERDMQAQSQAVAAFEADLAAQYAGAISEYSQQDEQMKKLSSRATHTIVRAPTDGLVQSLRLNTSGATVPAGATLMEIVPTDAPLEALLRLSPNHIGMVKVGQRATLRVTAFESSHYGTLEGTVSQIAADAITDSTGRPTYQVWVRIPQALHGARGIQQLKPGMVLVAAIVTGRHTVMDYLLRPIRNALDDLSPQST